MSQPFPQPESDPEASHRRIRFRKRFGTTAEGDGRDVTRRERIGRWMLTLGVLMMVAFAFLPAPYVVRSPGPVFNALGSVPIDDNGVEREQDVIQIEGAKEYKPTDGHLYVMTVNVAGNPDYQPRWIEVISAFLTNSRDVLPIELYYPEGTTTEARNEQTTQMMVQAQDTAIAAALTELDYHVTDELVVKTVYEDGAAANVLKPGDTILTIDGQEVTNFDELKQVKFETKPTPISVDRDGKKIDLTVTPKMTKAEDGERPQLGIVLGYQFKFPVDVKIQLGDVGGPSAGTAFALATYDLLTPGSLTGGLNVAVTGTIDPDGTVGSIGGVRQKLYAAVDAKADYFIVPESNCKEAISDGVPNDMPVYAVSNLDEALHYVETRANGTDQGIRTCKDALAANVPQS